MSTRRPSPARARLVAVLVGVGVLALVAAALVRLARPGGLGAAGVGIAVAVVLVLVAAVVATVLARTARRVRGVRAQRPGWDLREVYSSAELPRELLAAGRWESGLSARGGTPLTLAVGPLGVELWRGGRSPRSMIALPWASVAAVGAGTGTTGFSTRPALAVHTVDGAELTLLPTSPRGGLLPGDAHDVDLLVALIRAARDGRPWRGSTDDA